MAVECNRPSPLTAGRGRVFTASPPGQTRNHPCRDPPSRRSRAFRLVLFGNPVLVTHETHTRVGWEWIGFISVCF